MARGKEQHQARIDAVSLLGKDLARRAGRKCEWCEDTEGLRTWDSQPDEDPALETVALFCPRCRAVADGRRSDDPRTLRFLEGAVWNEVPAVGQTARQVLREVDADWARDTLELLG